MERNKNRDELLAAGQKKLQQFRKKKGTKGNESKSSGKAAKLGRDTKEEIASERASLPADGKGTNDVKEIIATSNAGAEMDSKTAVSAIPADETVSTGQPADFILDHSRVDRCMSGETSGEEHVSNSMTPLEVGHSSLVPKGDEIGSLLDTSDASIAIEKISESTMSFDVDISPEMKVDHGAEQVTDVGTGQEVGISSSVQGKETQHEAVNGCSLNDTTETVQDSEITILQKTPEAEVSTEVRLQVGGSDDSSLAVTSPEDIEATAQNMHFSQIIVPLTESGMVNDTHFRLVDQDSNNVPFDSSIELKKEMHHGLMQNEDHLMMSNKPNTAKSSELEAEDTSQYLASKVLDLSLASDKNFIKLSQLAEILRTLSEGEVSYLLMSRGSSQGNTVETAKQESRDVLETLKKELYVTSVSKDAFHLELSESQMFVDEIVGVNTSLVKVQGTNEGLAENIEQCNQELQQVLLRTHMLQEELKNSKDEARISTEVKELENKLQTVHEELSSLSSDFINCRILVDVLRAENEELSGNFKAVTEEKINLSQEYATVLLEKEKIAGELEKSRASLDTMNELIAHDKRQLEEKCDSLLHENANLLANLVDFKGAVEALEAEKRHLNDMLTSISEERKKLEEDKESLVENTSTELADYRDLVVTLQEKISILNDNVKSVMEEKNKVVEEKEKIYNEYEEQSHELTAVRTSEASLKANFSKAMDDLKEAIVRMSQLNEENEALNADLELHKVKLKQVDVKKYSNRFEEASAGAPEYYNFISQNSESDRVSHEQFESETLDDYSGFLQLKNNLENAEIVVQKIDSEVEGMQMHLSSFSMSPDKVTTPGVSRLIQAFESKGHADEQDSGKAPLSDAKTTKDSYKKAKLLIENLRVLLKELMYDAENASALFQLKKSKLHAAAANAFKGRYDLLRDYDLIEKANIEHSVLYETMLGYVHSSAMKQEELLKSVDFMRKQEMDLRSDNSNLIEKLSCCQGTIIEMQNKLNSLSQESSDVADSFSKQLGSPQAEVDNGILKHEEKWNYLSSKVFPNLDVLDASIKTFYPDVFTCGDRKPDITDHIVSSIISANNAIEDLHRQLEDTHMNLQEISGRHDRTLNGMYVLHDEINEIWKTTQGIYPNEAGDILNHVSQLDLQNPDAHLSLLDRFRVVFMERLKFESEYKQVIAESMTKVRELEDIENKCLKFENIMKLVEEIEQLTTVEVEKTVAEPGLQLESLVRSLIQRCREADQCQNLFASRETQLHALQGQAEQLSNLVVHYEIENLVFEHCLKNAQDRFDALNSEVQENFAELEQSEQRVSSLREKLSIAVTKGKGLILQRDNLKQCLAENSKELEKLSLELQSKDERMHELETKIKDYSEAGERMEALESELSYIRNSASALRESFLLKDSVLQRIEEVLEDLELPDHFHSRDLIEKIDWLCKSVGGNTLLLDGDLDQRSMMEGGSHNDSGFVAVDAWKEEADPNTDCVDELRRRSEELQIKLYGLAEQNEMLEQVLMERNNRIQRWEEILERADMPSQLRSTEPEDKFQWLANSLAEARSHSFALQQKVESLENLCESLTADVDNSQIKASEFQMAFQKACHEKEIMARDMEMLQHDNNASLKEVSDLKTKISDLDAEASMLLDQKIQMESDMLHANDLTRRLEEMNAGLKSSNESMKNEIVLLQGHRLEMEERINYTEDMIRKLYELVCDTLQDSYKDDLFGQEAVKSLDGILNKLIQRYVEACTVKTADVEVVDSITTTRVREEIPEGKTVDALSKDLEDSLVELMRLREENGSYLVNFQSSVRKVEELEIKNRELQDLLNEEQKSVSSLREKLNIAVRKGKSLVQQRDSMKQVIEQLNAEVEGLKSENENFRKSISTHEEQVRSVSTIQESIRVMESENSFLKDRLSMTEQMLQEKESSWNIFVRTLDNIGVGLVINTENPINKLQEVAKYVVDLRNSLDLSEQESRKSRRAAELLLAELNEVQERNDAIQEELENTVHELSSLSSEKDLVEKAKADAFAHVDKLSRLHSEEKDKLLYEIMMLKSSINNMTEDYSSITQETHDVFSTYLVVLQSLRSTMISFLQSEVTPDIASLCPPRSSNGVMAWKSKSEVFVMELTSLREQLYNHSHILQEETSLLSELVMEIHREYISQKKLSESTKADFKKLELTTKERETELHSLQEQLASFRETCATAISEIESWKDHNTGTISSEFSVRRSEMQVPLLRDTTNEGLGSVRDRLLLGVRGLIGMQDGLLEVGQREMKNRIQDLQKELQEKDIQRDRISMEFVEQIREAETNAKNYWHELQQAREQVLDSQKQMEAMDEEHRLMRKRIKELEDHEINSSSLQQEINSMKRTLVSKAQEIDELMQALDEQEAEMEGLTSKMAVLENELQQKNKELENIESSRTKALKKLSVTVSKFDELHYLSENLLSEIERLQRQLQERDGEISFLRREITRCTDDALSVAKMSKKNHSDEIYEFITWLNSLISYGDVHETADDKLKAELSNEYKEELQRKILQLISELETIRAVARSTDTLLHEERNKVEELARKEEQLRSSLREKESQLIMLQDARSVGNYVEAPISPTGIVKIEQMENKWISPGAVAHQVRSLRKTNNDQVAIAIDTDPGSSRLEEEEEDDDDKAHGFKSLTASKFVPRFTRPVSDIVDGLWMSCDRALMRRPALRLLVIFYWAVIHALLAAYVV